MTLDPSRWTYFPGSTKITRRYEPLATGLTKTGSLSGVRYIVSNYGL